LSELVDLPFPDLCRQMNITIPDKPRSRSQKYKITESGRAALERHAKEQ